MRHLLGERGQLAFQSVYPLLERPDLVTQRGQTGAQGHRDGRLRIFDQRADLWDDVARAHWYRHAKLAERRAAPSGSGPSPTDAVRDGSAKLGHPVQNVTREHGLTPLPR